MDGWGHKVSQVHACQTKFPCSLLSACQLGIETPFHAARGIVRFKTFYIKNQKISYMKILSYVLQNLLKKYVQY